MTAIKNKKYVRYSVQFRAASGIKVLEGYPTPIGDGEWLFIESPLASDDKPHGVDWQRRWAQDLQDALDLLPGTNTHISISSSLD